MKITQKQSNTTKELWIYIALAYTFGVLVRLVVLQNVWGVESFWYEGRILPIWSDDAGLYGYYAKQILSGVSYPFDGDYILAYIIASIVQVTGVHIDWVMLLLPAFLAPLVVVPIIIMGYLLNITKFAFYASLVGVVGINYYTRSYLGYLDTDTINLFLTYLLISGFVLVAYTKDLRYALISIIALVLLYNFYHSSKSLIAGVLAINLLMVVLFYLKSRLLYQLILLLGVSFILALKVNVLLAMALPIALIWLLRHPLLDPFDYRYYLGAIVFGVIVLFGFANLDAIYSRAMDYFKLDSFVTIGEYKITNVLATVAENQQRGIFDIFNNFVGITIYVIIATVGYIFLLKQKREFIFFLPLLILGYLSFKIGIRFTMYAEFVLAMGFVYLLYYLKKEDFIHIGVAFGMVLMLFNILRVNSYIQPKYFINKDIQTLQALELKPQDTIISWWDYGWPLWYYLGSKNTYIDNGANTHGGTVFVSKMLLAHTSEQAHDLAKIIASKTYDLKLLEDMSNIKNIAQNINIRGNIYILYHQKMLLAFSVFSRFGDCDLKSGHMNTQRTFLPSTIIQYATKQSQYIKTEYFDLNIANGTIKDSKGEQKLHGVVVIDRYGKIKATQYNNKHQGIVILYHNRAIYIDRKSFATFIIQSLFLHNIDATLFEPYPSQGYINILKLKVDK